MERYCVVDLETTGLNPFRHDRIIEVGVVAVQPDGTEWTRFTSLVNPHRDIGPTYLHGISASDVCGAPGFSGIAQALAEIIGDCVAVVGHNIRFDSSFLHAEYRRIGVTCPDFPTICTMNAAGGGALEVCCRDYGVQIPERAHSALSDAEATARLFLRLLADNPSLIQHTVRARPGEWPSISAAPEPPVSRTSARLASTAARTPIQRVLAELDSSAVREATEESAIAYLNVLDMALADRNISEREVMELSDIAGRWGLGRREIEALHRGYLARLISQARADGEIDFCESADLDHVASLLGIETPEVSGLVHGFAPLLSDGTLRSMRSKSGPFRPGRDQLVCFTGESMTWMGGVRLSRERAEQLARQKGFRVSGSVTKKVDLVVAADPESLSGKAVKARRYGVPIVSERDFWQRLSLQSD